MAKDVIVALDFPGRTEALGFLDLFESEKPYVKIGMELFYREGPDMVKEITMRGHRVFLDLKLHDIPNTVAGAVRSLGQLDVDMINLHAGGGIQMMQAAAGALDAFSHRRPLLIAVTVLTSLDESLLTRELLISQPLEETVLHYAQNAKIAGLDGVVCSPLEAKGVHDALGRGFVTVTPGIRFADARKGDQQRVSTPAEARVLGSDYIVVGRPVTQAEDPVEAYRRCVSDFVNP
ncbi:MAG: orotidine-5'-phosphate decarboxylase [Eubacteriales bacterium]|nr:orotidine-5'-phosphate decarboxylase [Eubacteriales bacterium]